MYDGSGFVGNSSSANNHQGGVVKVSYANMMNNWGLTPTKIAHTGISEQVSNGVAGAISTKLDNYVEGPAWDLHEALEKYTKDITDLSATIESSQTGFYKNQVQKIKDEWQKEWEKGKAELLGKNPTKAEIDKFSEWEGLLKQKYEAEIDKIMSDVHSKALAFVSSTQFDSTVGWGKYGLNEQFNSPDRFKEFMKRNFEHTYKVDSQNPYNVASLIQKRWDDYTKAQNRGDLDTALNIRKEIIGVYNDTHKFFDEMQSGFSDYFEQYSQYLQNSPTATSLQKERGDKELSARKNEFIYEIASKELEMVQNHLDNIKANLDDIAKKKVEIDLKLKDPNITKEAKEALETDRKKLVTQEDINKQQYLEGSLRARTLTYTKLQAEQMKNQPQLLRDFHQVAKQSLEDGLVKFLTDGVNEAESLGDALRDLATGILKEIQSFFAKQLVTDLMTRWFPFKNKKDEATGEPVDPFAYGTNYIGSKGRNYDLNSQYPRPVYNPAMQKWGAYLVDPKDNPFAQKWEDSPLNPNAKKPWEKPDAFKFDLSDAMNEKFGKYDDIKDVSLQPLTQGAEQANQALSQVSQTASSAVDTSLTNLGTKLDETATSANNASTALNSVASSVSSANSAPSGASTGAKTGGIFSKVKGFIHSFARGGMVRGVGTSTSDSIPAMLSNGEAVINAKAVKRLGTNFIHSVNRGDFTKIHAMIPHFATGGIVGDVNEETSRGMTSFAKNIGTNVSTTNNMNIALVRDEQEAMRAFMGKEGQRYFVDFTRKSAHITSRF